MRDVRNLAPAEAARGYPVRLRGVVTYYHPAWGNLFVQDATAGIFAVAAKSQTYVPYGTIVDVVGISGPGDYAPVILDAHLTPVALVELPRPLEPSYDQLITGKEDSQWISIQGVVRKVVVDPEELVLEMVAAGGRIGVHIPIKKDQTVIPALEDAEISVRGACGTVFNNRRQLIGLNLFTPSLAEVHIRKAAPRDPFSRPQVKTTNLLGFQPEGHVGHRVKVAGVVTWCSKHGTLYLQDEAGGVYVEIARSTPLTPGAFVEVVGFPTAHGFSAGLQNAFVKRAGALSTAEPRPIGVHEALAGDTDALLVRLEGRLLEWLPRPDHWSLSIQAEDQIFEARLSREVAEDVLNGWRVGSRLQLVGVCAVEVDENALPRSFRLLLRNAEDVQVLERPPWWTSRHGLMLLWCMAALGLATLGWVISLRRRVRRQTDLIRERLQREVNLETRFRELFENANDVVYTTDLNGSITSLNKAGELVTGYSRTELVGRNLADLVAPGQRKVVESLLATPASEDGTATRELAIVHKDGRTVTLEVSTRALCQEGQTTGLQGIARDITERKRLEEQLRQSQKMEAVGRLAGGVAHDFNNLLTVINGYSDLVTDSLAETDPSYGLVQEIKKAGDRAAGLTRQLLAFSRKQVLAPTTINLNAVVLGMEKMLSWLIGEDIDLAVRLDPSLGTTRADLGQVEQVLLNLAVNARDAMPDGGNLLIQTQNVTLDAADLGSNSDAKPGPFVMLAVTDSGCGMTPEVQARLFEPFFTTKGPGKGTGLGLATVYGIISQSGGHIAVTSQPNLGTTFRLYLPRAADSAHNLDLRTTKAPTLSGNEVLMLVEDDPGVRSLARQVLEMHGYTVLVAANGHEALRLCESHSGQIHLVLTDVVMPQMNGRELAERLGQLRPGLRFLYMSGYTDDAVLRHGIFDEGIEFLQKPFTTASLTRKVREVLEQVRCETP